MKKVNQLKYEAVREQIKGSIASGELVANTRLPSQQAMAKDFGVSHLTICRAFEDLVEEGLIVRRRGSGTYVRDTKSKNENKKHLHLGVLISSEFTKRSKNSVAGEIIEGVISQFQLEDKRVTMEKVPGAQSSRGHWVTSDHSIKFTCLGEPQKKYNKCPTFKSVKEANFDGVIAIGIEDEGWLNRIRSLGIPMVLTDFCGDTYSGLVDEVVFDAQPAYRKAVRKFAKMGLERIFFIGERMGIPLPGEEDLADNVAFSLRDQHVVLNPESNMRLKAYREAMEECGLPIKENYIYSEWTTQHHTNQLSMNLLSLKKSERPQAILCHDFQISCWVTDYFKENNCELIGAGASYYSFPEQNNIQLKSYPRYLGQYAIKFLLDRIANNEMPFVKVGIPLTFS